MKLDLDCGCNCKCCFGSKKTDFWELSKDMESDDENEKYDPGNVKKRGQGPKISVKKTKW